MPRKNTLALLLIAGIFAFSICALVLPLAGRQDMTMGLDLKGGIHMVYQADTSDIEPGTESEAIDGAIAVIERRVNVLGVSEPVIQKQGEDRIVVELPGISEIEKAKNIIGQTALLEFGELVADEEEEAKWENERGRWKPATAEVNGETKELTSTYFEENTYVDTDNFGRILLVFEWNEEGSKLSEQITGRLLGQPLGIFLGTEALLGDDEMPIAPIIQAKITDRGQIEGLSRGEATEMSQLLNAGRIPIPLTPIYEQSVSPILGSDFIDMTLKAGIIGIILVMLFILIYYRLPGFLASLSLIFYGAFVLALFKLIPVTLTLAGLGGFILSIGMAVDANVLIFERMKEELRMGRSLGAAIETGFDRAWTAIKDSNVTTFIVCIILFWMGSILVAGAPVKGFAVTLLIGVAVSMFTAIVVTRSLLRLVVRTPLRKRVSIFKVYSGKSDV